MEPTLPPNIKLDGGRIWFAGKRSGSSSGAGGAHFGVGARSSITIRVSGPPYPAAVFFPQIGGGTLAMRMPLSRSFAIACMASYAAVPFFLWVAVNVYNTEKFLAAF